MITDSQKAGKVIHSGLIGTMKILLPVMLILVACGGKLSDEQRAKLKEGMETQEIRKVSDAELTEGAMAIGKEIASAVEKIDRNLNQKQKIDSLGKVHEVRIYSLVPDEASLKEIEGKLVEAYIAGTNTGTAADNLQRVGEDSLLFTRPVFRTHPDGSLEFSHAIGVKMSVKKVVLSLPEP